MLDHYYKQKRTLLDFRRGPLGPFFDGFAEVLEKRGYCKHTATTILGRCCLFNSYLVEEGHSNCKAFTVERAATFTEIYHEHAAKDFAAFLKMDTKRALLHFQNHLIDQKVLAYIAPKKIKHLYSWILDPFLDHLLLERKLSGKTVKRHEQFLTEFLQSLGEKASRETFGQLSPIDIENYLKSSFKESRWNLIALSTSLRVFLRHCAVKGRTKTDLSGLILRVSHFAQTRVPRGMADTTLQDTIEKIDRSTSEGARNYALMLVTMAYGIRAVQVATITLDDFDWNRSTLRVRAAKGGKEVTVPLLEPVGDAIVQYLQKRKFHSVRSLFLGAKAPFEPLNGQAISLVIRKCFLKANVSIPRMGSTTLRNSWAIRALENDSPIKAIADGLGQKYIDTAFIYAKANMKKLREVTTSWPGA